MSRDVTIELKVRVYGAGDVRLYYLDTVAARVPVAGDRFDVCDPPIPYTIAVERVIFNAIRPMTKVEVLLDPIRTDAFDEICARLEQNGWEK